MATTFLRFRHLKKRGIVQNWPTLGRLIDDYGFPPGRLLSPNTRVWTEDEIDAWLASRPIKREAFTVRSGDEAA